jgi:hypothetical protein
MRRLPSCIGKASGARGVTQVSARLRKSRHQAFMALLRAP